MPKEILLPLLNGAGAGTVMLAVAWLVNSGFLYLRREYVFQERRAQEAIDRAIRAETRMHELEQRLLKGAEITSKAATSYETLTQEVMQTIAERIGGHDVAL